MLKLPKTIKMVITDFDGIVTDNCVYIADDGKISRKLNFKDVMGFSILRKNIRFEKLNLSLCRILPDFFRRLRPDPVFLPAKTGNFPP